MPLSIEFDSRVDKGSAARDFIHNKPHEGNEAARKVHGAARAHRRRNDGNEDSASRTIKEDGAGDI